MESWDAAVCRVATFCPDSAPDLDWLPTGSWGSVFCSHVALAAEIFCSDSGSGYHGVLPQAICPD